MTQTKIGWRPYVPLIPYTLDSDAQSFINVANITNTTQKIAINTLVTQLKVYGIWTKMKALYPMVGGSAASHKFNLKDPRDLDAAYRLQFNGGWVHSSTGAKPDGISGTYADTKISLGTSFTRNSVSHSTYVRSNVFKGAFGGVYQPVLMGSWYQSYVMLRGTSNTVATAYIGNTGSEGLNGTVTSLSGMLLANRPGSDVYFDLSKNGTTVSASASFSVRNLPTLNYYISAINDNGTPASFDDNEISFYHIGDGLSVADVTNFYTAVQTFQTTLGRQIGTPITSVSDPDAQSFIAVAGLVDNTQKNAVNDLVSDLKTAGLWTKMKAIYPFVGGNATAHKFNLKDPRDLAAAFALQFIGGMSHTSNGAVPNGSNAYALTSLTTGTALAAGSQHLSFYSKTNQASSGAVEMGATNAGTGIPAITFALNSTSWNSGTPNYFIARLSGGGYGSYGLTPISDTRGFAMLSRTDINTVNAYWNGAYYGQNAQTSIAVPTPLTIFGRAYNVAGSESYTFSGKTCAFASIGDGLTAAETDTFYMIVQKYQTALGRQEGTPVTSLTTYDSSALAFFNYAGITDTTQKSAVNTLVTSLKTAGIWTKMKALYPMVGGSSTSHKFNLKDPRDMNAAFRLSFSGEWTHTATGAQPNGTGAYANTFLVTRGQGMNNSLHLSFYSRTDVTSTGCDIGGGQAPNYYAAIYPKYNNNGTVGMSISVHDGGVFVANSSSSAAFYLATRNNTTHVGIFRNSTKLSLSASTRTNNSDMSIILGALNDGGIGTPSPTAYSTREQAFASIGDGLTDTEAAAFYTAIQAYQTALGRQV
jgi:hypothetical protein